MGQRMMVTPEYAKAHRFRVKWYLKLWRKISGPGKQV
jgi:hypothetical protein